MRKPILVAVPFASIPTAGEQLYLSQNYREGEP
jgi:hypothetical protein